MDFVNSIRGNLARMGLIGLLLVVAAIGLAACGGDPATPTPTAASSMATDPTATPAGQSGGSGTAMEVGAVLKEWSITLNAAQVDAGQVKFVVSNEGQFGHDLVVLDSGGNQVGATPVFNKADGTKELVVDVKPGAYKLVCDVPGHTAQGMTIDLTVK